ncbi:endonuclease/exonuclease/phosphatase family protein [Tanacetum coccineum]
MVGSHRIWPDLYRIWPGLDWIWPDLNLQVSQEIGWTYDSKANPMLSANWKLQKRLDRVLVSLRDLKFESINMVGTQSITEVTYEERQTRFGATCIAHSSKNTSKIRDDSLDVDDEDELDGEFPEWPDGWIDAWTELKCWLDL